jgi:hypothetical protein
VRKKRVILLCLIGAVLALIALLAYTSTTAEPPYDGHPLSYWVLLLADPIPTPEFPNPDHDNATKAIDHIGVAALPFLVKWIQQGPPRWRTALGTMVYRAPFPFAHGLSSRIIGERNWKRAVGTCYAFEHLGKRAMPAFDDLCRLANDTNRAITASAAVTVLAYLGTNAVPPLVAVLTNPTHPARLEALKAVQNISKIGDAAELAVPAITNCLNPANAMKLQIAAISALGNLRACPQISVPALISALENPRAIIRVRSIEALSTFGPKAASAIPALTNALNDAAPDIRRYAARALHDIDPTAFPNAP